ncbi:MAG: YggT family protein [Pseudomonadota bacterium]
MGTPLTNVAAFIIPTIFGAFMAIVLMRFLMQYVRASFANPFGQFILSASNPVILPLRKIIPSIGTLDTASLLIAFVTHSAFIVVLAFFTRQNINVSQIILWSAVGVCTMMLTIFMGVIIMSVISSWLPDFRHQPIMRTIEQLAAPILSPFRKLIPDMGGIDLSPMLAFLLMQCITVFLRSLPVLNRTFILGF